jgi:hypothetical protein
VRSVVAPQADIVEPVIVKPGQPRGAFLVLPYPFAEAVLDLLLGLARRNRFLLVDDAGVFIDLVVDRGRASVERIINEIRRQCPRRPMGGRVADGRFRGIVERERPGGDGARMADSDCALGRIE